MSKEAPMDALYKLDLLVQCLGLHLAEILDVDPVTLQEQHYQLFEQEMKKLLREQLTEEEIERYFALIGDPVFRKVALIGWQQQDAITAIAKRIVAHRLALVQ